MSSEPGGSIVNVISLYLLCVDMGRYYELIQLFYIANADSR
jgi:hypothetical protein